MPWPAPPVPAARNPPPASWTGCFWQSTCFGTLGCCRRGLASSSLPRPRGTWCSAQPPLLMPCTMWNLHARKVFFFQFNCDADNLPCYEGGPCGGPLRESLIVHLPRHPPPCWNKDLKLGEVNWAQADNFFRMFWTDKSWQRTKRNKGRNSRHTQSVLTGVQLQQWQNCLYTVWTAVGKRWSCCENVV